MEESCTSHDLPTESYSSERRGEEIGLQIDFILRVYVFPDKNSSTSLILKFRKIYLVSYFMISVGLNRREIIFIDRPDGGPDFNLNENMRCRAS